MNYVAYEIRLTKDTPTGSSMGTVECQGKYDYVMKKWRKIVGKYIPVT